MAEFTWLKNILPAFAGGLLLSVLIERLLRPLPQTVNRPNPAWILHLGLWLAAFTFELMLFQRPYFAAAFVLAVWLLIVLVSNAKFVSLREPFVFSDFEYFTDALRHPRLYIPFLGMGRALLATAVFVMAGYLGWTLEAPLTREIAWSTFAVGTTCLWAIAGILIFSGSRHPLKMTFDPVADIKKFGLAACLWHYAAEERKLISADAFPQIFSDVFSDEFSEGAPNRLTKPLSPLPNIVILQSESFFDVRRVFPHIAPAIMREWDSTAAMAIQHGRLNVAAWGANTVRTEFSFLTGLHNDSLGIHRFNPYRKLALSGIASMAHYVKNLGYRTVCIHPYPASFYNRATVFPALGFDEFIDIRAFNEADKFGPYIGDIAVAEKVASVLANKTEPIFIFVITMENHGPLHLEKITTNEIAPLFTAPLPSVSSGSETLAIYARHLANADKMLGQIRDALNVINEPAYLCVYGDHVPIMPEVYAATATPDGLTDYLIWGNQCTHNVPAAENKNLDANIADLGAVLLRHAGLMR